MVDNNELAHIGIPGMHWGHKKSKGWSPKDNSVAKQHIAKSGKKLATPFTKPPVTTKTTSLGPRLTDAQLKSRINRLQMEQTYATLTKKQISPGRKIVTDILTNAIKINAQAYLTKMIGKKLGLDPASNAAASKIVSDAAKAATDAAKAATDAAKAATSPTHTPTNTPTPTPTNTPTPTPNPSLTHNPNSRSPKETRHIADLIISRMDSYTNPTPSRSPIRLSNPSLISLLSSHGLVPPSVGRSQNQWNAMTSSEHTKAEEKARRRTERYNNASDEA